MIAIDWAAMKEAIGRMNLGVSYISSATHYVVFIQVGVACFYSNIQKAEPATEEQLDFEQNFKDV